MQQIYTCHICWDAIKKPVVTPCGHLFCWACIYQWLRSNQEYLSCPVCKSGLEIGMLRSIMLPHEPRQKMENGLPPRPRPHGAKARNRKDYGDQMPKAVQNIGMNLYRGVLLAGYGIFPPCFLMSFQFHKKALPSQHPMGNNSEYVLGQKLEIIRFFLIAAIIVFGILI